MGAMIVWMGVLIHLFVLLILFVSMSCPCFYSGSSEEFAFKNLPKCGMCLLFILALCDVGILGVAAYASFSTLMNSSVSFGLAFTASFAFDTAVPSTSSRSLLYF